MSGLAKLRQDTYCSSTVKSGYEMNSMLCRNNFMPPSHRLKQKPKQTHNTVKQIFFCVKQRPLEFLSDLIHTFARLSQTENYAFEIL